MVHAATSCHLGNSRGELVLLVCDPAFVQWLCQGFYACKFMYQDVLVYL